MKKSLIALGILIVAALALPIIGNSLMQHGIDERVAQLQSYGLESQNVSSQNSYLKTNSHFEFLLKDADAFVAYLNSATQNQIPSYSTAAFEGIVIGVDLEYSNIPWNNTIAMDIYPIRLSQSMEQSLQTEKPKFYEFMKQFFADKGLLYHIDYDIVSEDFDGFVKNIDENQTLDAQTQLSIVLKEAHFFGKGDLLRAQNISTSLEKLEFRINKEEEALFFALQEMKSENSFTSQSNYRSHLSLKKLLFNVHESLNNIEFTVGNVAFELSSSAKEKEAQILSQSSIDTMTLASKEINIEIEKSKLHMALQKLDLVNYEALVEAASKMNNNDLMGDPLLLEETQKALTTLLSKGLVFEVEEFSTQNILLSKKKSLHGFFVKSKVELKADPDFAQKLELSPLLLASGFDMQTEINISKKLYELFLEDGVKQLADSYAKVDGENLLFKIDYKNAQLSINDKSLR